MADDSVMLSLSREIGELTEGVRTARHATNNLSQQMIALHGRIDKHEEKVGGKIDVLVEKLSGITTTQARGLGFFAGVTAVIGVVGGFLLFMAKLIFGGHG